MTYRDLAVVKAIEIEVYPLYDARGKCPKCGDGSVYAVHEPAYRPPWWAWLFGKRAHPERMRRHCATCRAVYYERPLT